jgi:hypothetical protein
LLLLPNPTPATSESKFGQALVQFRDNVDAPTGLIELHEPVGKSVQRVVATLADIATSVELSSSLPNQNVSSDYSLATKPLHTTSLSIGIATVAAGALTFLMCHRTFTPQTKNPQTIVSGLGKSSAVRIGKFYW